MNAISSLVIGSRGSKLALWQANWVKAKLEILHPGLLVRIDLISTTGDRLHSAPLSQIGGKGVFTKELEDALLDSRVDFAVHSLKDLPTTLPDGLQLAAVSEREDARDALLVTPRLDKNVKTVGDLPVGSRVGTSSPRRASQLLHFRRDLAIVELRGNIETRIRKLDEGDYDAIVLATAGLARLGFEARIVERIAPSLMLPAVGQGALGIEARADDSNLARILEGVNHDPTRLATAAERSVLRSLGGGCAVPIAAHAWYESHNNKQSLVLEALVAERSGARVLRERIEGQAADAEALGSALAEKLIAAGASELLDGFQAEK